MSSRPANSATQVLLEARACGIEVLNLSDSNPTHWGLGYPSLGVYCADPRGPRTARETLARFLQTRDGRDIDPDRLYLLSSTSQGYAWLLKLLCDPHERVLAPRPGYPLVDALARLESVKVSGYRLLHTGDSWEIDFTQGFNLVDVVDVNHVNHASPDSRPKALIVINPNNPTGSYIHGWERARLLQFCREHQLALIADEVFFDFDLPQAARSATDRARLAGNPSCLTFALDGLSKNLAAPGAKIAWLEVSGPVDMVDEALHRLDVIADAYLPFADSLAAALPDYLDAIPHQRRATRERCQTNLATWKNLAAAHPESPLSLLEPEGGWSALLRFPAHLDEDRVLRDLVTQHALSAQPGYFFDMSSPGYLNISLLPDTETFATTLPKLWDYLEAASRE